MSEESPQKELPAGLDPVTKKFVKGNKMGTLGRGVPRRTKDRENNRRNLQREAKRMAQEMLEEALPQIMDVLAEKAAKGDVQAIGLALKHSIPILKSESYVPTGLLEHLQQFPAEERMGAISGAVLSGAISAELGEKLTRMARAELDVLVIAKLRKLAKALPKLSMEEVVLRLQDLAADVDESEPKEITHE